MLGWLLLRVAEAPERARAALAALGIALRLRHAHGGGAAAAALASRAVPALLAAPTPAAGADGAVAHTLFELVYHAQGALPPPLLHDCLRRALSDLRAGGGPAAARLGALKLLGALLSASADADGDGAWGARPEEAVRDTLGVLESLATIDESAEVRALAARLKEVAFAAGGS